MSAAAVASFDDDDEYTNVVNELVEADVRAATGEGVFVCVRGVVSRRRRCCHYSVHT